MTDKEKFLFNLNDFSNDTPVNALEDQEPSYSEDELNQAREESYKIGVDETTQRIRQEQDERTTQCLEAITVQMSQVIEAERQRDLEKSLDTTRLTLSIVKKLMPNLSKTYAEDEITALVKQSLADRSDEPRLVVVVHDTMLDPLKVKIDDIAQSQAFQGQVIIVADDSLSPVNCRIEWADGGIEKDFNALYSAIENAFHSVLQRVNTTNVSSAEAKQEAPKTEMPQNAQAQDAHETQPLKSTNEATAPQITPAASEASKIDVEAVDVATPTTPDVMPEALKTNDTNETSKSTNDADTSTIPE